MSADLVANPFHYPGGAVATNPNQDLYVAVYAFDAENPSELTLLEGDIIRVYDKSNGEWREGQLADGRTGLFPANRVVEYTEAVEVTGAHQYAADPSQVQVMAQPDGVSIGTYSVYASVASPSNGAAPLMAEQKMPAQQLAAGAAKAAASKPRELDYFKPVKPPSKTYFGLWASAMAYLSGYLTVLTGFGAILWGGLGWGLVVTLAGVYSLIVGPAIIAYEYFWGQSRSASKVPWRAMIYLALSIFMYFSIPTIFAAVLWFFCAGANLLACIYGEEYDPPESRKSDIKPEDLPQERELDFCAQIYAWLLLKKEQNQVGVLFFLGLYVAANIVVWIVGLATWVKINDALAPGSQLSGWAPLAKAFGYTLDLNCAIIVVPVLRSIIRWLYNRSTADEGCFAKSLRAILAFVPLDRNIEFHKIIAKVILFGVVGHVLFHLINYIMAPGPTISTFGTWPWISGGFILVFVLFIYSGADPRVRAGQFEIFWYSHHCFIGFFFFLIIHGHGGIGPNFWKWFLGPGTLYLIERGLRMYRARQDVVLLSVTHMKPNVFSLEFAKEGVFGSEYKEGQYIFICCPYVSRIQWHPFTISSAPQEKTVTVHIRKCGAGSWTNQLADYVTSFGPVNATYYELTRQTASGLIAGKILGPDGKQIIQIDGPHSAPTQHVGEYDHVMVVGAGIGCTPIAATLKSITQHKWRYYMGRCHPDHAYFFWVVSHPEIDSFRWLIRAIKDCEDDVFDMRAKAPKDMSQKRFEFHIFVSSVPKGQKPLDVVIDDEIGFWGVPKADDFLDKVRAPFTELEIYKAMMCPDPHVTLGDIHIWSGRPKWGERFAAVSAAHHTGEIGVLFCGNPAIALDLETMCHKYSSIADKRFFKLHKENF